MALTITYDGYGVVANADAISDTGGSATGTWRELGGGTIGLNPDVPYYGVASMGSKYASKTGYSYIDGITALDFTPTTGAQAGEYIYCWINIQSKGAFDTLANNGFSVMIGSSTADHYMWKIAGTNDANGWSGGWKLFVIDPQQNTGTIQTGTPDLSAVNTIGVWIDTIVSVRADSIFQSQIFCAKGLTVTGTPTVTGEGLDEIVTWATDLPNRAAGMFQKRGNTYYSLGSLTVGDGSTATTLSANGNSVEYEESSFWNGTTWVTSYLPTANNIVTTAAAAIEMTDTGISGFIDNKLAYDTSLGNASSFNGGSLKLLRSITTKSTDTFSSCVFSLNDALSLGAATYDGCTFNDSGTLTLEAGTTFSDNKVKPPTGTTGILTPSISIITGTAFTSGGTGHAIEINTPGTYNWIGNTDGGTYGATGTTDAVVYNNSGGLVTINVASGDTPTYLNGTSATTVVNVTFTLTLTNIPTDVKVTIVNSATRTELQHTVSTGVDITYAHAGGETVDILLNSLAYDPNLSDIYDLTLDNGDQSIKFQMLDDLNYENP